jgi:hypothetical protein
LIVEKAYIAKTWHSRAVVYNMLRWYWNLTLKERKYEYCYVKRQSS